MRRADLKRPGLLAIRDGFEVRWQMRWVVGSHMDAGCGADCPKKGQDCPERLEMCPSRRGVN